MTPGGDDTSAAAPGTQQRSRRQAGLTALYLGVFATVWFSVPASDGALRTALVIGSAAGLASAAWGAVSVARAGRGDGTGTGAAEPRDRATDRRYLSIVFAELAAAGLGAILLRALDQTAYVPVLVAAVVGAHFFPLAGVLRDPGLRVLGIAVCAVAMAGFVVGVTASVEPGLVAGAGTGSALLLHVARTMAATFRDR